MGVPRPWVPLNCEDENEKGAERVEKDDKSVIQDSGDGCHGEDMGQPVQGGVGRSIRPGSPVPATVLVAEMTDGSLLLQGWRDGPNAFVIAEEAGPLRRELAVAFGSAGVAAPGVPGESR